MIRLEDTLTDIARATQRAHECRLRLKLKLTPRTTSSSSSLYHTRSAATSSNRISSLTITPRPLVHSATTKLIEAQRSEYLKNDQYFHCRKPGHKTKECYARLAEVNKDRSDSSPARTYLKKETANIVEADSESNSS
jgi:hypothetical protein